MRTRKILSSFVAGIAVFAMTSCGESNTVTEDTIREHLIDVHRYSGEPVEVSAQSFCDAVGTLDSEYGRITAERAQFETTQDATPEQLYGNLVAQQEVVQGMENHINGQTINDDETLDTLRAQAEEPTTALIDGYTLMKSGEIGLAELDSNISVWENGTRTLVMYCKVTYE